MRGFEAIYERSKSAGIPIRFQGVWTWNGGYEHQGVVSDYNTHAVTISHIDEYGVGHITVIAREQVDVVIQDGPSKADEEFCKLMGRSGYTVLTPEERAAVDVDRAVLAEYRTANLPPARKPPAKRTATAPAPRQRK